MSKIAFLFPGQGAQYVGMGKDFYEEYPEARQVFEEADDALGYKLSHLCFNGPSDELMKTEVTQPAILTTSIAILKVIQKLGVEAEMTAGLSLGEYSALVYGQAIRFSDAVRLVEKRGRFMQEAVPIGLGKMAALIGIQRIDAKRLCEDLSEIGVIECSNFNCPGQIVIGGETKAIEQAVSKAREYGAKRALLLPVSAPFHTSLLKPAANQLEHALTEIQINNSAVPVVTNIDARLTSNKDAFMFKLKEQVCSSVLWEDSMKTLFHYDINHFIEIGPGSTLCGFLKKIDRSKTFFSVENIPSLNQYIQNMEVSH